MSLAVLEAAPWFFVMSGGCVGALTAPAYVWPCEWAGTGSSLGLSLGSLCGSGVDICGGEGSWQGRLCPSFAAESGLLGLRAGRMAASWNDRPISLASSISSIGGDGWSLSLSASSPTRAAILSFIPWERRSADSTCAKINESRSNVDFGERPPDEPPLRNSERLAAPGGGMPLEVRNEVPASAKSSDGDGDAGDGGTAACCCEGPSVVVLVAGCCC